MDVLAVCEYLEAKKQRSKLESQLSKLKSELSEVQSREAGLQARVDSGSLITAKSVKVINAVLSSHRPLKFNCFPVLFARAVFKNGHLHLQVVFAQPLFHGWRTDTPYKSWTICPLSLDTPKPPSENHIADYLQSCAYGLDAICWEQVENGLRLWTEDGKGVELKWEGNGGNNP